MTQPAAPLYDATGQPQTIADSDEALNAVRSGKVGAVKGSKVPVRDADGALWDVPAESLHQLPQGWSLASQADLEAEARSAAEKEVAGLRAQRKATGLGKYETAVDAANAAGQVVARGPGALIGGGLTSSLASLSGTTSGASYAQGREDAYTLGLGKVARKAATEALYGKEAAQRLVREKQLERELSPEAYSRGSTEAGFEAAIASSAAPGGLAKLLVGPQAVPEIAGALAEAGLAKSGLTAGQTVLGHALKGSLAMGIRGGVEGAIAGGASELSEEMFGDPEVVGEKVWLAAGKGALAGFGLGAVLGGAVPVIGSALRKGADQTADTLARAEVRARAKMPEIADEEAFRALSPHPAAKFTREAEARIEGGAKAVGNFARESGIVDTSSAKAAAMNNSTGAMLGRAEKVLDDVGAEIGERMRGSSVLIGGRDIEAIANKLVHQADETGLPLAQQAGRGNVVAGLRDYVNDLMIKGGMVDNTGRILEQDTMTMADAYAQRRALDNKIYKDYSALEAKGPMELMRKFRAEFDDLLVRKMEEAGEAGARVGGPWDEKAVMPGGKTLRELKGDYQKAVTAKKILEDAAVKDAKNRAVSLTDYITGAAAAAKLGPIGLAAPYVHRAVRERGNAVAAWALGRIGDMGETMRAIQESDKLLKAAAEGAAGTKRTPYRSVPSGGESLAKRYDTALAHVQALQQQARDVESRALTISRIPGAPRISDAFAGAITRSASELAAQAPPTPPQMSPLQKTRPSNEEMSRFVSQYEAMTDPSATLKEVAAGSLDPAKTRILEKVAPNAFEALRADIEKQKLSQIEQGKIPAQNDLMKLHLAFGITLDPTLTPQALLSQQTVMESEMEGGADQGPQPKETGRRGNASSLKQQREPTGADRFER